MVDVKLNFYSNTFFSSTFYSQSNKLRIKNPYERRSVRSRHDGTVKHRRVPQSKVVSRQK